MRIDMEKYKALEAENERLTKQLSDEVENRNRHINASNKMYGEHEQLKLDHADLTEQLAEKESERDNWMETARQHLKNEEFYRELVVQIGEKFGDIAYISDDGSVQEDVLCLKVPELVSDLTEQLTHQAEVFLEMVRAPMVPPQDSEVTE